MAVLRVKHPVTLHRNSSNRTEDAWKNKRHGGYIRRQIDRVEHNTPTPSSLPHLSTSTKAVIFSKVLGINEIIIAQLNTNLVFYVSKCQLFSIQTCGYVDYSKSFQNSEKEVLRNDQLK